MTLCPAYNHLTRLSIYLIKMTRPQAYAVSGRMFTRLLINRLVVLWIHTSHPCFCGSCRRFEFLVDAPVALDPPCVLDRCLIPHYLNQVITIVRTIPIIRIYFLQQPRYRVIVCSNACATTSMYIINGLQLGHNDCSTYLPNLGRQYGRGRASGTSKPSVVWSTSWVFDKD